MKTNTDYLTVKGLAQFIGVQESTVIRYARDKKLLPCHIGELGELYFAKFDAKNFQKQCQAARQESGRQFRGKSVVTHNEEENEIVQKWKVSKHDSASIDVQIGLLSEKIRRLEEELKEHQRNPRDFVLIRGQLVNVVGDRRKKLEILKQTATNRYYKALERLDLRM